MTTSITIHVNGRYKAAVTQTNSDGTVLDTVVVDGDYPGTTNPGGKRTLWMPHPARATFDVVEEYLGEAP